MFRWQTALILLASLLLPAQALNIRVKDSSVVGQFRWVWQPNDQATRNPGFSPSADLFSGVAWPGHPVEWFRHYALISPRHFVGATHYPPDLDWKIRFLGKDGELDDYEIASIEVVKNSDGEATDLFIGTLKTPVDLEQIDFFSILNLPAPADYVGKNLVVFGKAGEAAQTVADGVWMLEDEPGFDTTQFVYFDYDPNGSDPADIHYQSGDSGSPAFVMQDGKPALIGNASSLDTVDGGVLRSSLSLLPHYREQIDAMMETEGCHLTRALLDESLAINFQSEATGDLIEGKPGAVTLSLGNSGAEEIHNVILAVAGETPPDQVTGSGWICEKQANGSWLCRRGGISAGETAEVTAAWNTLPESLSLTVNRRADGVDEVQSLPLYSVSAAGTSMHGSSMVPDSDADGVNDELEYAFGGDDAVPSLVNEAGLRLLPQLEKMELGMSYRFTRRQPSFEAGMCYLIEFSECGECWSGGLPVGTELVANAFDPQWPGFEEVHMRFPVAVPRAFVRVRFER